MAANPIAANLLMGFLLFMGLISAMGLPQEFLPEASLDRIQVVVPYPGAAPEEVVESIVRKIEEQIQSVEGLKRTESSAAEGLGSVIAEFRQGTNMSRALADVKAQVDRILTFPAGAERAEVREVTSRQSIFRLMVYGNASERAIKELTYRIEDGILALPEVSYAEISGVRNYEISIEVPLDRLACSRPDAGGRRVCRSPGFAGALRGEDIHGPGGDPRPHPRPELRAGSTSRTSSS